jgi:hypothetical protein
MSLPDALVDTTYLTLYDPTTRPLTFLGLETVVVASGLITLLHALREHRRGAPAALFSWLSVFVYGVCLEIVSYNAFPNFTHGQFTVMFYHHKLPLYVTMFYPALIYTSMRTVGRLGLSRWVEPLVVGGSIVAMDFPFDILGPDMHWWAWDAHDPTVAYRWYGVPVTSYYWHLSWGAVLAFLCRWAGPRIVASYRPYKLLFAIPVAGATLALGRAVFLPFDLLVPLGVSQGTIVLAAIGLAVMLLAFGRRAAVPAMKAGPDWMLLAIPLAYYAYHDLLAVAVYSRDGGGRLAIIAAATGFALVVNVLAYRRGATVQPSGAAGASALTGG